MRFFKGRNPTNSEPVATGYVTAAVTPTQAPEILRVAFRSEHPGTNLYLDHDDLGVILRGLWRLGYRITDTGVSNPRAQEWSTVYPAQRTQTPPDEIEESEPAAAPETATVFATDENGRRISWEAAVVPEPEPVLTPLQQLQKDRNDRIDAYVAMIKGYTTQIRAIDAAIQLAKASEFPEHAVEDS